MRKLRVFNQVSLDGYFADENGDMSWAHRSDEEWRSFVSANASGESVLVFGRITYDLMASYWPTPQAQKADPAVAERMNDLRKIVFSKTLDGPLWKNTRLIKSNILTAMQKLKGEPGPDLVIMGSGTLVSQFTDAHLIDEYQVVVNPIVLGRGRTMFSGLEGKVDLRLRKTRAFGNGNVVLWYDP